MIAPNNTMHCSFTHYTVLYCVHTCVTDVCLLTASEVSRKAKPKLGGEDVSFINRSELLSSLLANFGSSLDQMGFFVALTCSLRFTVYGLF